LELVVAYGAYQTRQQPGLSDVAALSPLGLLPTAIGYNVIVQYLSKIANQGNVLCVDVGGHNVVVSALVDRQPIISIHSDLGLGQSAATSLEAVGIAQVRRWLPFDADDERLLNYAWNKVLRPSTVPQTTDDMAIEHGFTRAIVQQALSIAHGGLHRPRPGHTWPPFQTVVGAGAVFSNGLPPELGALLLLDSVQPFGVMRLLLDPGALIPALGSLAYVQPLAVTQTIDNGGLLDLGTAICPNGQALGTGAIKATVTFADGHKTQVVVASGELEIVPLAFGQEARVSVQLGRGLSLGQRGSTFTVRGGAVGIIFDGRGRPLTLPNDAARRQKMLSRWHKRAMDSFEKVMVAMPERTI
jgi:MutL protein